MKTFFTSDTHFFHSRIIQYCLRPFADATDMNEQLIANWNNVVSCDDVVYHLGDFAFGDANGVDRVMRRLNFKHFHFIKGNHDEPFCDWYHSNKDDTYLAPKVSLHPSHLEVCINKQKFVLCHYAMATFNHKHHNAFHLCGHSHYNLPATRKEGKELGKVLDVGVDGNNFYPYSFDEIVRIMDTKPTFSTLPCLSDHHSG